MSSKRVLSTTHPAHPKTWIFNNAKVNGPNNVLRPSTIPDHVTLRPKTGPYDPLRLALHAGEGASVFYACPCSKTAFKSINAPAHWKSDNHINYLTVYETCVVRHAYFYAQDKDRKLYLETGRNPLWGQLNSEGKTPKGKRRRFSIDNDREDTSEDEDFCPKAKRAESPPSPLHVRPKLPRMLREYRKSPRSSSSDDSDDGDAADGKMSPSPLPAFQDHPSYKTYDDDGDVYQRVDYGDPPHRDMESFSENQDTDLALGPGQHPPYLDDISSILSGYDAPTDDYEEEEEEEEEESSSSSSDSEADYLSDDNDDDPHAGDGYDREAGMSTSDEGQNLLSTPSSLSQTTDNEAADQMDDLLTSEDREPEGGPAQTAEASTSVSDSVWLELYQDLYKLYPGYIPQTALSFILQKIRKVQLTVSPDCKVNASSLYRLGTIFSENKPVFHSYEDPKTKRKVKYRDLKDAILQLSASLPRSGWFQNSSSDRIPVGHPMRASRWQSLENEFATPNILGLYLFIDGFQPVRYSKVTNYESLSIGFVNTSYEVCSNGNSKCCLMVLPKGCDSHFAIRKCFIEPIMALRADGGVQIPKLSPDALVPVLFSVLGDDVGQRKISGIGGPTNPNAINRWLAKIESIERPQLDIPTLISGINMLERTRSSSGDPTLSVGTSMDVENQIPEIAPRSAPAPATQRRGERSRHKTTAAIESALQAPKQKRKSQPATPASRLSSVAPSAIHSPTISVPYTPQEREDIANGNKKGFQKSPAPARPSTRTRRDNKTIISAFDKLEKIIHRRDELDKQPNDRVEREKLQAEFEKEVVPDLRENGLLLFNSKLTEATIPPWLLLKEVKLDFFGSFSPCLLHNIDMGLIPTTILIVGVKLGIRYRNFMNDFLQGNQTIGGISLDHCYRVQLFRGPSTLTSQKATWYRNFFMKFFWLICEEYFKANSGHPKLKDNLEYITTMVSDVKFIVHSLYSKDQPIDKALLDQKIFDFRTSFFKYKSTYVPNMETLDAYHHLIDIQGYPIYTSTQRWEPIHQTLRRTIRNSNKADIASDMISRVHMVEPLKPKENDTIVKNAHKKGLKCLHKFRLNRSKRKSLWDKLASETDVLLRQAIGVDPGKVVDLNSARAIHKILGFYSARKIYCLDSCKREDESIIDYPKTLFKAKHGQDEEKTYCLRASFTFRLPLCSPVYHYFVISPITMSHKSDVYNVGAKMVVDSKKLVITKILDGAVASKEAGNTVFILTPECMREEMADVGS